MNARMPAETPVALTIATSDSGAGAGIQADLLTFSACGVYGVTALAALTAQNPHGVSAIEELPPPFLKAQLDQLAAYYPVKAMKTGMLFSASLIEVTVQFTRASKIPLVVDPVMVASSGSVLLKPDAIATLENKLLPQATLVTPNLDEASVLLGRESIAPDEMEEAAHSFSQKTGTSVLLKGGHLEGDQLTDVLAQPDGNSLILASARITGINTHGSGCTLSAAITAALAKGRDLPTAVKEGHAYLQAAMRRGIALGGETFIGH